MRVQFAEGLQSQGVASNQVVLQSTSSGDFVLSAEGVVATFRLDVVSTNVDAVKSALESYVSSGKYDTALKGAASEFSSVKTQVDTSSYKVKKYSSMNGVVVVLLILLVIFVLLFAALVVFYLNIRKNPTKKGGLHQLNNSSSFVPAGNLPSEEEREDYSSARMHTPVSDEEEEPRRKPKRKQYVSDEEEEEDYRPARKNKGRSMKARA